MQRQQGETSRTCHDASSRHVNPQHSTSQAPAVHAAGCLPALAAGCRAEPATAGRAGRQGALLPGAAAEGACPFALAVRMCQPVHMHILFSSFQGFPISSQEGTRTAPLPWLCGCPSLLPVGPCAALQAVKQGEQAAKLGVGDPKTFQQQRATLEKNVKARGGGHGQNNNHVCRNLS